MRVFHGSYTMVSEIDLTKGRNNLDFGNSNTFSQLAKESTKLYKMPWQEIYGILKNELETIKNDRIVKK